jgi:uncharacterized iron-regulated membrane protein
MNQWLIRFHLALALLAGIFLLSASISGALLVFAKEAQQAFHPEQWQTSSSPKTVDVKKSVTDIQHLVMQHNFSIEKIQISDKPEWPWIITLSNNLQWNYDPNTREVIHSYPKNQDPYHRLLAFHRWLLLEDDTGTAKPWARHITSTAALILIIEILLGYFLWLRSGRPSLKRPDKKTWRTQIRHLHLLFGVTSGAVIVLIAFTGISFNWPTAAIYEAVTFSKMQPRAIPDPVSSTATSSNTNYDKDTTLEFALSNGMNHLPHAQIRIIYFPKDNKTPMMLRMQHENQAAPFSYVWVELGSGQVVGLHDATQKHKANKLWDFKYGFHTGVFGGMNTRLLWLFLALMPGLFTISGLWLYFERRRYLSCNQPSPKYSILARR